MFGSGGGGSIDGNIDFEGNNTWSFSFGIDEYISYGQTISSNGNSTASTIFSGNFSVEGHSSFNEQDQQSSIITTEAKFFDDETKAYNYMWDNSIDENTKDPSLEYKENGAFIIVGGIIVLPNYKNDYATTKWKEVINIKENGKGIWTDVEFNGKWYSIKGWIHTHPHAETDPRQRGMRVPSDEDYVLSKLRFPNLPAFVISRVETFIFSGTKNAYYPIGRRIDLLSGKIKLIGYHY
jgi:hypothetical protein